MTRAAARVALGAAAIAAIAVVATDARADVIVPIVGACIDKAEGAACKACEDWKHATCGTCQRSETRCYPESCFGRTEAECMAGIDDRRCTSWGPGELHCVGAPCVCEEGTGERPSEGVARSCASGAPASMGALALALLLALRRRSR